MAPSIHRRRPWEIVSPGEETDPKHFLDRRRFLKGAVATAAGLGAIGATASLLAGEGNVDRFAIPKGPQGIESIGFPVKRNAAFTLDRPLTGEKVAATTNNFYEFTTDKKRVATLAQKLPVDPWSIEVAGLCEKTGTFDYAFFVEKMPFEERLYRFRCVETWAMAVPWTGYPLARLIEKLKPKAEARWIRFETFLKPEVAPGQRERGYYRWPYHEGLRLDEAMNELTLVVTGIYGHAMPRQHGAPLRIVCPWKYGYKSPKSIVRIELTAEQPKTFWNVLQPEEYGFYSNVDPGVPHPRWSQATEQMIGTGERRDTLKYNGYGGMVDNLYTGKEH